MTSCVRIWGTEEACNLEVVEAKLVRNSGWAANVSNGNQSKKITLAHLVNDFIQNNLQLSEDTTVQTVLDQGFNSGNTWIWTCNLPISNPTTEPLLERQTHLRKLSQDQETWALLFVLCCFSERRSRTLSAKIISPSFWICLWWLVALSSRWCHRGHISPRSLTSDFNGRATTEL